MRVCVGPIVVVKPLNLMPDLMMHFESCIFLTPKIPKGTPRKRYTLVRELFGLLKNIANIFLGERKIKE